jgi:hypothetical protein
MRQSMRSLTGILRYPSAFLPLAMSLAALALVLYHLAFVGTAPQADEGTAAHIWQLLMVGQLPLLLFFAVKWLPRAPKPAAGVLALQLGAVLSSLAPVYLLHF